MSDAGSAYAVQEGDRVGRFVVFRDRDGHLLAIAPGAVSAIYETEEGRVLIQFGGKLILVDQSITTVLAWLDGGPSRSRTAADVMVRLVRKPFAPQGGRA